MKIAFISPYSSISSIGIRTISALLKSNGFQTRIVFLPLQKSYYSREGFLSYPDDVVDSLANLVRKDDLIGISLMTNYHESIKDLTVRLKKILPEKPILWGGIHPTVLPEACMETADYVCVGEGEIPVLEFCRNFAEGKSLENIPGIWSKTNGQINRNNPEKVIMNINQIPPPDYDLEENYILSSDKIVSITSDNMRKFIGQVYITMYTRGCAFHCSYCCNSALRKIHKGFTKIRAKTPEYIVREIKAIKDKFPFIRYVIFEDDTLSVLSEKDIKKFSEHYKKSIGLPFIVGGIHPLLFTEKKYDCLVDGGMLRMRMGIQTGSRRILEIYERKQDNETVIKMSHLLQKHSKKIVMPNYDVILDNPWEKQEDKLQTINLLKNLASPFSLTLYSLAFFPGTNLYSRAIQENIIDDKIKYTHYLDYEPTYLNLVIALFGLFKVPEWLLKLLLSKRLVNTKRKFLIIHYILFNLILLRKGICAIFKGDISLFPPNLQLLLFWVNPTLIAKLKKPFNR